MATIIATSLANNLWNSLEKNLSNVGGDLFDLGYLLSDLTVASSTSTATAYSGYLSDGARFNYLGTNLDLSSGVITNMVIDNRPSYFVDYRGSLSPSTLSGLINYANVIIGSQDTKLYGSIDLAGYGTATRIIQSNKSSSIDLSGAINYSSMGETGAITRVALIDGAESFILSGGSWSYSDINNVNTFDEFFNLINRGNDVISTGAKNDVIKGGLGSDSIDGGAGIDTAQFSGLSTSYVRSVTSTVKTVTDNVANRDGTDTLTNIERLKFTDTNIALDIGPTQNAGSVYMIYKAAFNRAPDASGMGYWLAQKDNGSNIVTNIAQGFVNSAEFTAKYGANPSNATFVDKLYQNVLGRSGDAGGVAYWNQQLDNGSASKAAALAAFATLPEGASNVASLIANGIPYTEFVG